MALEAVWAQIRRRHPDVPHVVVTFGAGSIGARPGVLRLGHFAAARWRPASGDASALGELFVGGEGLAEGPVDVLATLLHEAAHGLATTRKIKDTSRAGAYHNERYRKLALEVGLEVERDPQIGWSITLIPEATVDRYAAEVEQLRAAIAHIRDREPARSSTPRSAPTYVCACPRRLRMAPSVFAQAPVVCGACDEPFTELEA